MTRTGKQIYEFGSYRIDVAERLLLRDGQVVPLTPKVFDTLLVLVENSGHILSKDEVIKTVWPDAAVEEANLTKNISTLRKALGETPDRNQYIETIPWRGYRFVASVREVEDEIADLVVEERTRSRVLIEREQEASHSSRQAELEPIAIENPLVAGGEAKRETKRRVSLAVLAVSAALVMAIAAVILLLMMRRNETPAAPVIRSIAVLPFKSLSAEAGDQYLGLGMADTLITRLSNIKQLIVRPTSAVRKYSNENQDPIAAGREQQVDAVLEGSIQKAGGRIRVTARLINTQDGTALWAGSFDEKYEDIFRLQDSIVERLAGALTAKLTGEEQQRLAKRYTEDTEAYQAYIKGRYFWNKRTADGLKKGIEHFQQAIRVDPDYALAYVGLADSYAVLGSLGLIPSEESRRQAKAAATKALELDEALADAHASLAGLDWWDWAGAERGYQRALELNPNHATARQWYASHLTALGRFDEAIAEIHRALQIDPTSLTINAIAAATYYLARRNDEAIEQCRKTLEMDPDFFLGHHFLAAAYAEKGRYEEALAAAKKAQQIEDNPVTLCLIGYIYAASGSRAQVEKTLHEISKRKHVPSYSVAGVYAGLGEREVAFEWLEKAVNQQEEHLIWLKVDPQLDPLRSDPRFTNLLRRVGLA